MFNSDLLTVDLIDVCLSIYLSTSGGAQFNVLNATHVTELPFVFGESILGIPLSNDDEIELSKQMIEYWSQFTSYGNPNGISGDAAASSSSSSWSWPAYDPSNANTTIINLNTGFGLAEDVWGYYCERLEELIFFNSTVNF